MEAPALITSIIALIIAILAYYKVGGAADVLDGMEAFVRGTEEKGETPRFHRL